jgi:tetratricopeptide (TPR) repeat protein
LFSKIKKYENAEEYYLKALNIIHSTGDKQGSASIYHWLGIAAQEQQHWEQANTYYQQAIAID